MTCANWLVLWKTCRSDIIRNFTPIVCSERWRHHCRRHRRCRRLEGQRRHISHCRIFTGDIFRHIYGLYTSNISFSNLCMAFSKLPFSQDKVGGSFFCSVRMTSLTMPSTTLVAQFDPYLRLHSASLVISFARVVTRAPMTFLGSSPAILLSKWGDKKLDSDLRKNADHQ